MAVHIQKQISNALDLSAILIEQKMMKLLCHHILGAQHLFLARHGAKIKWVDIDPDTFVASLETIKKQITKKLKL